MATPWAHPAQALGARPGKDMQLDIEAAQRGAHGSAQAARGQRPNSAGSVQAVSSCYTGMGH